MLLSFSVPQGKADDQPPGPQRAFGSSWRPDRHHQLEQTELKAASLALGNGYCQYLHERVRLCVSSGVWRAWLRAVENSWGKKINNLCHGVKEVKRCCNLSARGAQGKVDGHPSPYPRLMLGWAQPPAPIGRGFPVPRLPASSSSYFKA